MGLQPSGTAGAFMSEKRFPLTNALQQGRGGGTMQPGPHLRPLSFRAKVKATKLFPRNPPPFVTLSYP